MMSVWLLTNASAQAINGTLVKLIKPLGQTNYFIFLGTVAIVITLIILVFSPKIKSYEGYSLIKYKIVKVLLVMTSRSIFTYIFKIIKFRVNIYNIILNESRFNYGATV